MPEGRVINDKIVFGKPVEGEVLQKLIGSTPTADDIINSLPQEQFDDLKLKEEIQAKEALAKEEKLVKKNYVSNQKDTKKERLARKMRGSKWW